jgi:electron transport complex protein RnfG
MKLISEVLPPSYDNLLLDDYAALGPTRELGLDDGGRVRARKAGQPAALILEPPPPTATAAAST